MSNAIRLPILPALVRAAAPLVLVPLLGCGASAEPIPEAFAPPLGAKAQLPAADDDAVFVSPLGDDANAGSRDTPVRSFARAITLANARTHHLVLCAGTFDAPLALTHENGAGAYRVVGGAACQGNPSGPSLVRVRDALPLRVFAVAGPVSIANVTFEQPDAVEPGASAVAAQVGFVDDVTFTDVTLRAGRGAAGATGATQLLSPCEEPIDPRDPTHVGRHGRGARVPGRLTAAWVPEPGEDGGILRFPRSSRCVEPGLLAGTGGMGGGASIALLAHLTHITLVRSTLEAQDSGSGGAGGPAQAPACDPLTQRSCEVLDIGGGGGGAGGVSASIVHRQGLFDTDTASKLVFGKAGAGGSGGRGARWLHGTAGVPGLATTILAADDFPPEDLIGDEDAPSM